MRWALLFLLLSAFATSFGHSATVDEKVPENTAIAALASKAVIASPREQCFLYAELVHQMTELAGRQMVAGQDASGTLKSVREYADRIHMGMAQDTKKLKNAQILMEHTAFRLNEILHSAALDDRPVLESTLKQLNQVQNELMMQVFRK